MRATVLLILFPLFLNAQMDFYGEELWVQEISEDTTLIRGQHFGIDSGEYLMYRWVVHKDGELYGTYLGKEGNPFLRIVLSPGNYSITRYTDYYTSGEQTGVTKSKRLDFYYRNPLEYSSE